ncbi:MAG TPA: orotidine-5'-phosphate decarboxylase [Chitinophagales bacterium]|jgi:orotidine-5'-phosphate decarboxylase|nr:orotidine-5'-phosphate decarboxylase [Chitinophagales bacterium]MBP6154094.1 orotidine-5'-phosphate decarboxylase [Chitinophagales bacterium]HQV78025.1 orotidine-5'-phosphate decarboxylase [Chitinophagales bacterium]HQW78746.1 orotidine-5'-phosphate decarboxylase [Chitinophagales bacterium]HRB19195.1 orotidine-5'-phosphate decarboxylase [Chitinophagales bacterium]
MNKKQLLQQINRKKSYLCIGLDSDISKIPPHLLKYKNPILEFNKQIIDATHDVCVAYKPNLAFYEIYGAKGWETLEKTITHIPENIFKIADAKRGDIGNTSTMYAQAFLENMPFDAITIAPYMGEDSITPFLKIKNKWVIVLGLTSNKGAQDFQFLKANKKPIFQHVIEKSMQYGTTENMMFVVGATKEAFFKDIRVFCPDHFLLVPGVGAQGGDLQKLSKYGMNKEVGLLVNATRSIIYASNGKDFAEKAREEAMRLQTEMKTYLKLYR